MPASTTANSHLNDAILDLKQSRLEVFYFGHIYENGSRFYALLDI